MHSNRLKDDWTSPAFRANVSGMIDPKTLDDLAGRLANSLPASLQLLQDDLKKNLRANLALGIRQLASFLNKLAHSASPLVLRYSS